MDWSEQKQRYRELKEEYLGYALDNLMDMSKGMSFEAVMAAHVVGLRLHGGEKAPDGTLPAAEWFRSAADRGFISSRHNLGICYEFGTGGVPQDRAQAFEHYGIAAAKGWPESHYAVARFYGDVLHPSHNMKKYFYHLMRGAEKEYAPALVLLGECYIKGIQITDKAANALVLARTWDEKNPENVTEYLAANRAYGAHLVAQAIQTASEQDRLAVVKMAFRICRDDIILCHTFTDISPKYPPFGKGVRPLCPHV